MDILLNNILNLSEAEITNGKIELNMREGRNGPTHLDKWLSLNKIEKSSGKSSCSYWGWYSATQKNFNVGNHVFSFVQMAKNNEWLFISAAEIVEVPVNDYAVVRILEKYKPFFGRIIIKYRKGNTYSRYTFNLEGKIEECIVKEILTSQYNGEQFEGYDRVYLPFSKLDNVFNGRIMPTYYEALKKVTGIYCLTDTKTGKLYIGSATGTEGVAQRWGNYLESKHGGNEKLIQLFNEKGEEYFKEYFTYTLIEYFSLSYDPKKVKEREQYWKKCLSTIENGYNSN